MIHIPPQRFPLGRLRITPAGKSMLAECKDSAWTLLFHHGSGSWVSEEGREQFERAVENGGEIVSFHVLANGARIAVRTSKGHSETVISLAEELS